MIDRNDVTEYADWLADLANEEAAGEDLRNLLATRIKSAEAVELAAKEVEISRRIRLLMINLRQAEIEVPADFEAKLMARVSEDATLLSLLEFYFTAFGKTMVELLNALFSLFPEARKPEAAVA